MITVQQNCVSIKYSTVNKHKSAPLTNNRYNFPRVNKVIRIKKMMVSRGFVLCFESTKARRNRKEIKKYVKKNGNSWEIILSTILIFFSCVYAGTCRWKQKQVWQKKHILFNMCRHIYTHHHWLWSSTRSDTKWKEIGHVRFVFSYIFILLFYFVWLSHTRVYWIYRRDNHLLIWNKNNWIKSNCLWVLWSVQELFNLFVFHFLFSLNKNENKKCWIWW